MARRNEIYPGTSIFREDYPVRAEKTGLQSPCYGAAVMFGRADSRTTGAAQWRAEMKYIPVQVYSEKITRWGRKNGSSVTVIRRRSYVRAGRQPNDGSSAMARRNEIYPGTSIFREDLSGAGRLSAVSCTKGDFYFRVLHKRSFECHTNFKRRSQ